MKTKALLRLLGLFCFFLLGLFTYLSYEQRNDLAHQSQGHWIGVASYQPGVDTLSFARPTILSFQNDQWQRLRCTTLNGGEEIQQDSGSFTSLDSTLFLHQEVRKDTLHLLHCDKDNLYFRTKKYHYHYRRLNSFEMGKDSAALSAKLMGREFRFSTTGLVLEFLDEQGFICPRLDVDIPHRQTWLLIKYQGELFFWTPSVFSPLLQVESLAPQIQFRAYWNKVETITLEAQASTLHYDLESLQGQWQTRLTTEDLAFANQLEFNRNDLLEILDIRDSILIQSKRTQSDTLVWAFNTFRDKLIFPEQWGELDNRQWNILELHDHKLLLERRASDSQRHRGIMTNKTWFDRK